MANISIGKAWEETLPFVAREASLLLPVALLFLALPTLILQEMTPPSLQSWFAAPKPETVPDMPPGFALGMMLTILLTWFGSLALFALALRPGISVGEALRLSLARLPVLIGATFVVAGMIAGILTAAVMVGVALSLASRQAGAAIGLLLGGGAMGLLCFAGVRLVLINPVIVDRGQGVMASLRQAWALTRGHFWRLLGFLVVMMLLFMVAGSAAQLIVGLLGGLAAGADGARLAGGIAGASISAVVQVYMLVMIASLYRQARPEEMADIFR